MHCCEQPYRIFVLPIIYIILQYKSALQTNPTVGHSRVFTLVASLVLLEADYMVLKTHAFY
jgi:hypothetical protein